MISDQEEQLNKQYNGKSLRAQERAYIQGIVEDVLRKHGLIKNQEIDWEKVFSGKEDAQ